MREPTSGWDRSLDRRELIAWSAALAAGASPLATVLAGCKDADTSPRAIRAGFADWILRLHPAIEQSVGPSYARANSLPATQRGGGSASGLIGQARRKTSDWDVLVGFTPFTDMVRLVETESIEPWDDVIPRAVLDDIDPAIRREATYDGKLYAWPFLLDVVVQGWNSELVERAGLDPGRPPATWDEYIENARTIVNVGAAPYGCTFDRSPSRSLVPITYSFDTAVYTDEGLFDYTHEAVEHALEVLRRMFELANPDVLEPYTTTGAGFTSDEGAFSSQLAAYYVKFQNAHIRAANTWPDPGTLALSSLPGLNNDSSASLFFTTSIALARYGARKRAAASYARALTSDSAVWRESIGSGRQGSGQLPCFHSVWSAEAERPAWVPEWAIRIFRELRHGATIRPHRLGNKQFDVAQPHLNRYLTREEPSARRSLRAAMAAVREEAA